MKGLKMTDVHGLHLMSISSNSASRDDSRCIFYDLLRFSEVQSEHTAIFLVGYFSVRSVQLETLKMSN